MTEDAREALVREVARNLVQLDLPPAVRDAVMALVRDGAALATRPERADPRFPIRVARTFYKTSLGATAALGTSSVNMLVMLVDLYLAHESGQSISVSSLCIASGAAPTTALRQIGQLEKRGFVIRRGDERDRRRCWVSPTDRAIDLVRSLIDEWSTVLCT